MSVGEIVGKRRHSHRADEERTSNAMGRLATQSALAAQARASRFVHLAQFNQGGNTVATKGKTATKKKESSTTSHAQLRTGESYSSSLRPGFLVTLRREHTKQGLASIVKSAGAMKIASAKEFNTMSAVEEERADNNVLLLEKTGIAILDMDPQQAMSLQATAGGEIVSVDPEPIFFTYDHGQLEYLRGFRDAVNQVYDMVVSEPSIAAVTGAAFQDNDSFTWGLQATGVDVSTLSGAGVKVAVLDTGMDLDHPDFTGRTITSRSFIRGQDVQDENGHGTHCVGTACGPRTPSSGRGYGVAHKADIFVGKVLSNQGSSLGRSTLRGIEWAIESGVDIISLSLGAPVGVGDGFVRAFEQVGQTANENGILLVAAGGNDSNRPNDDIRPVASPANCPSFMAVAAIDRLFRVASFSNRGINPNGGEVDIAGPGVLVYSSAPDPAPPRQPPFFRQWTARNDTISGTSMATPHVAGIAALLKQANPNAGPAQLRQLLVSNAQNLPLPSNDVGAGLAKAPR